MDTAKVNKIKITSCVGLTKSKYCKCKVKLGSGSDGGVCDIFELPKPKTSKNYIELKTPVKSEADKNDYLVIKLKNGLKAILIKDNGDEKPAALAVGVNVGSFSDPPHVQGLAHFLEHMVFMGSEKYPVENAFDSFISLKGGSFNAFTASEETIYYVDIGNEHMYQAMDILSQFFISPLLKYDSMAREREAVESEYQLSLSSQYLRRKRILSSLGSIKNPIRNFNCGNLETLKVNIEDEKLYEELHAFRKKHYSAHKMTLALQTKYDLDTMASWVVETFSKVQTNIIEKDCILDLKDPFPLDNFNKFYILESTENNFQLQLTWSLPYVKSEYKKKPLRYLKSVFSYKGTGSLESWLRSQTWGARINVDIETNSLFTLFSLKLLLTEEGYKNYLTCIQVLFAFIKYLQNVGPFQHIWLDQKKMSDLNFKYSTDSDSIYNVVNLAESIMYYPSEDIITQKLDFEYDPTCIQYYLNLLTPESVNIIISSKNIGNEHKLDRVEKWNKAKYTSFNISNEMKQSWNQANKLFEFALPELNPYIPDDFTILPALGINATAVHPRKIKYSDKYELWYKQDNKFKQPKAYMNFYLTSPQNDIKSKAMVHLFVALFGKTTQEQVTQAALANLNYRLFAVKCGIILKFSGFNQNLHVLVDKIFYLLLNFGKNVTQGEFEAVKQLFILNCKNEMLDSSHLCFDLFETTTQEMTYTSLEKLKILSTVEFDDFINFIGSYFDSMFVYSLIQGNINETDACFITETLAESLVKTPLKIRPQLRIRKLEKGQVNIKVKAFNNSDNNCVTTAYFQDKPGSIREVMILKILRMLLKEPIFHQLRTVEQLGYSVSCNMNVLYGILGLQVTVISQSGKTTVDHVEERILALLESQLKRVENISNDEFNDIVNSIIKKKSEKHTSILYEIDSNWDEIQNASFIFDRNEKEIRALSTIKLKDVYMYYKKIIGPDRKLLMLHVVSNKDNTTTEDFTKLTMIQTGINKPGVTYITDINEHIKKLDFFSPHKIIE